MSGTSSGAEEEGGGRRARRRLGSDQQDLLGAAGEPSWSCIMNDTVRHTRTSSNPFRINQGSLDHVKVGPTPVLEFHNL